MDLVCENDVQWPICYILLYLTGCGRPLLLTQLKRRSRYGLESTYYLKAIQVCTNFYSG